MGWGTTFKPEIYLSRITFDSNWEIEEYIKEKDEDITNSKKKLFMFVAATPKDICPDDWKDEILTFLLHEINTEVEHLEELIIEKTKAELLLNYVMENNIDVKTLKT